MTADTSYSLESLERQWQATKSPKLGLQLAEQHRRRGDLAAGIAVLESGLEAHPEHRSSRVALSRYLVDSDRFEDALGHLGQIVRVDPVHMVANKLMVRAYIGLGRMDEARDKLDIYEMLGEGDPDVETLRAVVEGREIPAAAQESPVALAAPGQDREPVEAPAHPPTPPEPLESLEEAPFAAEPVAEPFLTRGGDQDLAAVAEPARHRESASTVDFAAPSAPDPSGEAAARSGREPVLQALEEPFGSLWGAEDSPAYWETVRDEGIFAIEPIDSAPRPADAVEAAVFEQQAAPAGRRQTAETAVEATTTLGSLYLEQGHNARAAAVFREVLARDPGNEAARRGLEAAEVPASVATVAGSVNERKRDALLAYRARLRRAVGARA